MGLLEENKLIEKIILLSADKASFSGLFNLDLSVCYFSKDTYLERFGEEPFQRIRMTAKEREVIQVKKKDYIIELFIACPTYERNLRIDLSTKAKEILFFGEIDNVATVFSLDERRKIKGRAKKEIQEHFSSLGPQYKRKSSFN